MWGSCLALFVGKFHSQNSKAKLEKLYTVTHTNRTNVTEPIIILDEPKQLENANSTLSVTFDQCSALGVRGTGSASIHLTIWHLSKAMITATEILHYRIFQLEYMMFQ